MLLSRLDGSQRLKEYLPICISDFSTSTCSVLVVAFTMQLKVTLRKNTNNILLIITGF